MPAHELSPAALAFDGMAERFDSRFTPWLSVAAQRRAVRAALAEAFVGGSRLLELGGGTGDDALWLAEHGRTVVTTDPAPSMVRLAAAKLAPHFGCRAEVVPAEALEAHAPSLRRPDEASFDGAFSNFAGLNCVSDLGPVARGLAGLVRPGGSVLLVLFGIVCPGEMIVEAMRRRPRNMLRRFARGDVPARLGGQDFTVRYHRARAIARAMAPWFAYEGRQGIGIAVPPSAAEPDISRHPRLLAGLEAFDRAVAAPLAMFGDHILYRFVRRDE